ncbi:MAG: putative F420-dependent oxidoreductase [Acidimicrobiales bacterium]|jgi:probable F420-dependent oxidoreductase
MTRPFRFGIQAFNAGSAQEWTDTAKAAEDLGYSCLHLADHYMGPGAAQEAASHPVQDLAAIPAMMAAAAVTSTIKVGARVMCCDYHHPLVLAKSLATIDFLSGGRLEPGFGAGWIASEYQAMGIPMARPGIRIDRMIDYVKLARQFFAGDELDMATEHVTANAMAGTPASPQPGGPKIMMGGGAKRVLSTCGKMADIVSINFNNRDGKIGAVGIGSSTAEMTEQKIGWIRDGAGDRFDELELEIGGYFAAVTTTTAATVDMMAGAMGLDATTMAEHPHALIGSVDEICETLEARRETYGISYVTFSQRNLQMMAPVVAKLTGK